MGLLDPKVFDNPWFQLGSSIIGNNTGYYGAFGPAFGAGMQDFQRQRALAQENARRNEEFKLRQQEMKVKQDQLQRYNQALSSMTPEQQNKFALGAKWGDVFPESKERRIVKGADGFNYYPDTGERVLPGVVQPAETPEAPKLGDVFKLRQAASKDLAPVRQAAYAGKSLKALLIKPGPFRDVASVYSLVKMLDPESVVREGEVALMNSASSLYDRLMVSLDKAKKGGALGPEVRRDAMETVAELMSLYEQQGKAITDDYSDFAGRNNLNAKDVLGRPLDFPTFDIPQKEEVETTPDVEELLDKYVPGRKGRKGGL